MKGDQDQVGQMKVLLGTSDAWLPGDLDKRQQEEAGWALTQEKP